MLVKEGARAKMGYVGVGQRTKSHILGKQDVREECG